MEKINIKKTSYLFWMVLVLLPLLGACQKEEEASAYGDLPLLGTKWQLVGFANASTGEIKLAEPSSEKCEECFTIIFQGEGEIYGKASINMVYGKYNLIGQEEVSIIEFKNVSEAGESPDGYKFISSMGKVNRFTISSYGLSLYYDGDNYLLFQPLTE